MKIRNILAASLFLGTSAFAQDLQNAIKATDNELFTSAEKELKSLIAKEPVNGLNYFYLGENFFAQKEIDSAVFYWKQAAEKDPTNAMSLVSAGKAQLVKGDATGGKENLTKALAMTKNKNAEVLRNVAKTYISTESKNFDETILLLEQAIKIDPKNEYNYILMGDVLQAKTPENANAAIKNYNKVLDINPKSARGIVRIGKIYQRVKADSLANSYYQEAQRLDPTYAPAYRENAELLLNTNKPKKAIEKWVVYLELNNSLEARYRYTTALFSGKQYCDAISEGENLKQKGFNNFYVERILMYSYAECTANKENATKGLTVSESFFKIVPQEKIIYLDYKYKGQLLQNSGKDSLAILEYEKAASMNEMAKKDLAGTLGKMYMKAKNYTKSIENYDFKAANGGLSAAELFELGRAHYFGTKNYGLADTAFTKLTTLSPSYVPGHFWKARTALQLDPKNEKWLSKAHYEKTFSLIKPEERLQGNNKNMALESAQYLGNYYYNSPEKDLVKAKEYYKAVSEIDPNDAQAKAFFAKVK